MMGRFDRSSERDGTVAVGADPARKLARAQRLAQDGHATHALLLFREVIALGRSPHLLAACVGAGNAYLATRRYGLAASSYTQALEQGAAGDLYAEALQNLGIARYVDGDRPAAREAMEQLAVLDHPVYSPLAQDNLQVLFGISIAHARESSST